MSTGLDSWERSETWRYDYKDEDGELELVVGWRRQGRHGAAKISTIASERPDVRARDIDRVRVLVGDLW